MTERIWRHASQHPGRPQRHDVLVQGGNCLAWTTTWRHTDDEGRPVTPGRYTLDLIVAADNIASADSTLHQVYDYTVTS